MAASQLALRSFPSQNVLAQPLREKNITDGQASARLLRTPMFELNRTCQPKKTTDRYLCSPFWSRQGARNDGIRGCSHVRAAQGFGSSGDSSKPKKKLPKKDLEDRKSASTPASLTDEARALSDDLRGTSIFLLGMMGSGKSTIGKILADALGYYFFDSDEVVEQAAGGASVSQIFAENGEEAFRDMETKVLSELSSLGRLVVSTGGGAILRPTNWSYLQHGITVFIDVPVHVLAQRVVDAGTQSRPLIAGESEGETPDREEQLRQTEVRLTNIFGQRSNLYRNADSVVSLQRISESRGVAYESITPDDIALEVVLGIAALVAERKQRDLEIRSRAA